jgi:hypothetical protein
VITNLDLAYNYSLKYNVSTALGNAEISYPSFAGSTDILYADGGPWYESPPGSGNWVQQKIFSNIWEANIGGGNGKISNYLENNNTVTVTVRNYFTDGGLLTTYDTTVARFVAEITADVPNSVTEVTTADGTSTRLNSNQKTLGTVPKK